MNTPKIEALYPYFLDMLRTWGRQPERNLVDMLEIRLRCELLVPSAPARRYWVALRDLDNPQNRFDQLGLPTEEVLHEQVPARVWDWVQVQLLTLPTCPTYDAFWNIPTTGWWARARASTPVQGLPGQLVATASEDSVHVERYTSAAGLAPLLRGMRAYQAKRRKRARRLVAQLWAYHWQKERAVS